MGPISESKIFTEIGIFKWKGRKMVYDTLFAIIAYIPNFYSA